MRHLKPWQRGGGPRVDDGEHTEAYRSLGEKRGQGK